MISTKILKNIKKYKKQSLCQTYFNIINKLTEKYQGKIIEKYFTNIKIKFKDTSWIKISYNQNFNYLAVFNSRKIIRF